jgi:amino-acid N-acetyltransferase
MSETVTIQAATDADRSAIVSLLQEAGLPTQDLPASLDHFMVGKANGRIVGTVGLEPLEDVALLRSLSVASPLRGTGLGKRLYQAALKQASEQKLRVVYLITTTADRFFEKQGFERIERTAAPSSIQGTAQFSGVCPSSAIVMSKALTS